MIKYLIKALLLKYILQSFDANNVNLKLSAALSWLAAEQPIIIQTCSPLGAARRVNRDWVAKSKIAQSVHLASLHSLNVSTILWLFMFWKIFAFNLMSSVDMHLHPDKTPQLWTECANIHMFARRCRVC